MASEVTYPATYPARCIFAEMRLLGALLLGGQAQRQRIVRALGPCHFQGDGHGAPFSAIVGHAAKVSARADWNVRKLSDTLKARGVLRGPISLAYLLDLVEWAEGRTDPKNIDDDITTLLEAAQTKEAASGI